MINSMKSVAAIMLTAAMMLVAGCKPEDGPNNGGGNSGNNDSDVRVTTYTPQDITQTTAVCGGDVIVAQGLSLNEFGVCWSTESNPTASDDHRSTTNWNEPFVCTITSLEPGTEYHVRAYALRGLEYCYGEEKSFTTETDGGGNNDVRVTTYTPQDITQTRAKCGGDVIVTQGLALDELGVCWSTEHNPTISDAHLSTTNWSETFVCTITGLEPGTEYHVRAYALRGLEYYYGDDKSFTTENYGGCWFNGHEYVDLGLPSGTLWATCNVGSDVPEGYGDYFAWGETQPKTTYNWSTYKYCNGDRNKLTKYCNDANYGYNGFTDNLTTLLPEDDAATANWGNGWCTPTYQQWKELCGNTSPEWIVQNGVVGCRFTAVVNGNNNYIFLPAAGDLWGDTFLFVETKCEYWSSSLFGGTCHAGFIPIYSGHYDGNAGEYRADGFTVRPVLSSSQNQPISSRVAFYIFSQIRSSLITLGALFPANTSTFLPFLQMCSCLERTTAASSGSSCSANKSR